ncbi:hypothetical protein [Tolypothrix sp. NIES-4075]|uniref:hypothetical protein n=1 Tax=Tolypothrix sp. NIES-4075 TaxID=2005459 RepID=UPI00135C7635|nr:hypothetical protein [Tolypothrix sp. NIES-4075]
MSILNFFRPLTLGDERMCIRNGAVLIATADVLPVLKEIDTFTQAIANPLI